MKEKISITLPKDTLHKIDAIVDGVYIRNRSQAIDHLVNLSVGDQKTAVILCGGDEKSLRIGKNSYCITALYKGKPVIEHQIAKLRDDGFGRILLVARGKILTQVFGIVKDGSSLGVKIEYIEEKQSKGTADSLRLIKGHVTNPFLVVYGDLIFSDVNIMELWRDHLRHQHLATLMMTTSRNPSNKGTLLVEGNTVLEFTQKPKSSDIYLVFSPVFVLEPEVLDRIGGSLETNIFPSLAAKRLLGGHLSSTKEKHIHSEKDLD